MAKAIKTIKQFNELLNKHDWYYMMSDDNRVYTKGKKSLAAIEEVANKDPAWLDLFTKYQEHMFSGEGWGTDKKEKFPLLKEDGTIKMVDKKPEPIEETLL